MRILFCSNLGDGAWFVALLRHNGHDVSWVLGDDKYIDTMAGIVPPPLERIDHPSSYDLIVFDTASHGSDADEARQHSPVIGSSRFAEQLEKDRLFGIEFMERCGINVPPYEAFNDISDAIRWLRKTKKRCVFKPCGNVENKSITYVSKSPEDMERYLEVLFSKVKSHEFVLQEFIEGTEISTEGWFNGTDFFALNHDLEEKKFMSGGIGPNTGCSGCVIWMPPMPNNLMSRGLLRSREALASENFVGPIDLNVIATEGQLFGLEWTPRFGYEGTCNLTRLLPMEFGEFLHQIAIGASPAVQQSRFPFAATIRITIPPYPETGSPRKYGGVPIKGIDLDHIDTVFLNDVKLSGESGLESLGLDGWLAAPIGVGNSIREAFADVESYISKLLIPDLQWRNDVSKCCENRYEQLLRNGWLRHSGVASA